MPIDPSIYAQQQPLRINTPFENLSQILQVRNQQQAGQALADERQATAEARRQQTEIQQRQQVDAQQWGAALKGAYRPDGSLDADALIKAVPDHMASVALKTIQESEAAFQKYHDDQTKRKASLITDMATRVRQLGDNPAVFGTALKSLVLAGAVSEDEASGILQRAAQGPEGVKSVIDTILHPEGPKLTEHDPTKALVDPTGKVVIPAGPKEVTKPASVQEYEYAKGQGYQGSYAQYQTEDANRRRPVTNITAAGQRDDAEAIADAIMRGEQPPTMTGLYRMAGPVRTALARKGYDFTKATLDWQATTKHLSALNSTQQTRLRQAVDVAYHSLDVIDDLAGQWKGGQFPVLNNVNLTAAKNGVYGQDAARIATQLEAQITDLTSELGNVYMGGNSPTDHALQLAGKNLSSKWSESVLKDMTKLARTNLEIRRNSMNNVGVAGASPGNIYAPPTTATSPAASGVIYAKDPQGKVHQAPAGTTLPQGWVQVQKAGG